MAAAAPEERDDGMNRHGFPQGNNFVPKPTELIQHLSDRLAGRRLAKAIRNVFNEVNIYNSHPAKLYKDYKESMEMEKYIYFFSTRRAQPGNDKNTVRRVLTGGSWKSSGRGKEVKAGGVLTGEEHTIVFYEEDERKTDWAMNEFTLKLPDGTTANIAVYRLYIMRHKKADKRRAKRKSSSQQQQQQQQQVVAQGYLADDASGKVSEEGGMQVQVDHGSPWAASGQSAAAEAARRAAFPQEASPASPVPLPAASCRPLQSQAAVALAPPSASTHWSWNALDGQSPPPAAAAEDYHADHLSMFEDWYNKTGAGEFCQVMQAAEASPSPLPSGSASPPPPAFAAPKVDDDLDMGLRWEEEFLMYGDINLDDFTFTIEELCGGPVDGAEPEMMAPEGGEAAGDAADGGGDGSQGRVAPPSSKTQLDTQ